MPKIPTRLLPWRRRIESARVWREVSIHTPREIEIMRAIVTRTPREEYDAAIARLMNQQRAAYDAAGFRRPGRRRRRS